MNRHGFRRIRRLKHHPQATHPANPPTYAPSPTPEATLIRWLLSFQESINDNTQSNTIPSNITPQSSCR